MPLRNYLCMNFDNHRGSYARSEELVSHDPPATWPCVCGSEAKLETRPLRFRHIGPVSSGLEGFNDALLGPGERKAGAELKTGRQIERWEQERGLSRQDGNGQVWREHLEQLADEASEMDAARAEGGQAAALEWVRERNILDVTDWTQADYVRWRNASDGIQSDLSSGKLDGSPLLADGGVECGPSVGFGAALDAP